MGRTGEEVQDLAEVLRVRVDQVEGSPVEALLTGDVVDGACDEVDRDDRERPTLDPDQGEEDDPGPDDAVTVSVSMRIM